MKPSTWQREDASQPPSGGETNQDWDDAEKGLYDSTDKLPVVPSPTHPTGSDDDGKKELFIETYLFPTSPIHEGLTPPPALAATCPRLSLAWPKGFGGPESPKPAPPAPRQQGAPKKKVSHWILFQLWYNTYRKLFTLVTFLNALGVLLAGLGKFPYADKHSGALVLGNLLAAVLFRNELFLRSLYLVAIYGLKGVCPRPPHGLHGHKDADHLLSGRQCISSLGRLRFCSTLAASTRDVHSLEQGKRS